MEPVREEPVIRYGSGYGYTVPDFRAEPVYRFAPLDRPFAPLDRPFAPLDRPFAPWRDRQFRFPILSRLARIYLTVQATSASSERVFSKAERVISKKRTSLSPQRAGSLIWLAGILKQEPALSLPIVFRRVN